MSQPSETKNPFLLLFTRSPAVALCSNIIDNTLFTLYYFSAPIHRRIEEIHSVNLLIQHANRHCSFPVTKRLQHGRTSHDHPFGALVHRTEEARLWQLWRCLPDTKTQRRKGEWTKRKSTTQIKCSWTSYLQILAMKKIHLNKMRPEVRERANNEVSV